MSKNRRFLLTLFVTFACVLASVASYAAELDVAPSSYRLGAGDELKMSVYGEPDLSGSYKVSSAGSIAVPLIGEVALEGLSLPEAENLITKKFANGYLIEPSISLEVQQNRPFYIMGEVKKPGQYQYVDSMTALQAVALAGGFTYRARQGKMRVKTESGSEHTIEPGIKIQPGDVVIVEERLF